MVLIDEYVYLVPYVEDEKEIFLKTIIPSRKASNILEIKNHKEWVSWMSFLTF